MTVKEIMAKYKVSRTTVYRWISKGIPVMRIGNVVRFDEASEQWLKNQGRKEE